MKVIITEWDRNHPYPPRPHKLFYSELEKHFYNKYRNTSAN